MNYLRIAWRNLLKSKFFSLLNIVGLAIGLASFLLITLFVSDELSYDRYNKFSDRIFRINSDIVFGGSELKLSVASDPMGAALKKDYPQVEEFTRIYNSSGSKLVKKGNSFLQEERVAHVDSTFFTVFTLPAIEGDTRVALNEPNTVVITASTARKYFNTIHAIGKFLETNDRTSTVYKVTAVIEDIPEASHFNFDMLFSMDNVEYDFGNYMSHNFQTYLLLKPGVNYKTFEKNFPAYINKYILPQAKQFMQINSMAEFEKSGNKLFYTLVPVTDIHLRSDRSFEIRTGGNIQYVYIFSAVAAFILLIACINFMNLSTARSANRAREVGIRKVLGTEKNTLIFQFLTESILVTIISMILAIGLAWLSLPYFNQISGKLLTAGKFSSPGFLLFILLLPLIVGILAGIYPAFYLSAFKPIEVLKGKINAGVKRSSLRSVLVVFQFATSIILIVGTIVVYRQLNYIQHKKIGFNKDQVLVIDGTGSLNNSGISFRNELLKVPGIKAAAMGGFLPVASSSRTDNTFSKEAVMDTKNALNMQIWSIDENYIPTLGMEMLSGRNFSKEFLTDSSAIIINESTAQLLGYKEAIGKKLYNNDSDPSLPPREYNIVGVVKNFHFESLKQSIGPLSFKLGNANWSMAFKVDTKNIQGLIQNVEKTWSKMAPNLPFRYSFLDDSFNNMYQAEQKAGKVALSFSILAILIACLGLFGLASFMAEQRTKEIGVRKVLGASINNIVSILSKDFVRLVLIACVFAIPVAGICMHYWLQEFAFRINLSWWIFLVAGLLALFIALFTVSFQSVRAALSNPVKSLRSE